ncbi:hypothetical protein FOZ63_011066, partial [Perkinsus olseni]
VTYPDRRHKGWNRTAEFTVLADEDALRKYRHLLSNISPKNIAGKTPSSLKAQQLHRLGSGIFEEYLKSPGGFQSDLRSDYALSELMKSVKCEYTVYLRRPEAGRAFRLTAFKAEINTNNASAWR